MMSWLKDFCPHARMRPHAHSTFPRQCRGGSQWSFRAGHGKRRSYGSGASSFRVARRALPVGHHADDFVDRVL
jgi:hypothetical protein